MLISLHLVANTATHDTLFYSCVDVQPLYLLHVWHYEAISCCHGHSYVVAVMLQQSLAPWLKTAVQAWVLGQRYAERLHDER